MRITLLGTGTSHGVPSIDCMLDNYARCPHGVCQKAATDRRYYRTRASIMVEVDGLALLIDTSQDFRQQMLENRIQRIDAVLYTHAHADHIYGLPDIRSFCGRGRSVPIYAAQSTLDSLHQAFDYVFNPPEFVGGGIPSVDARLLDGEAEVLGTPVLPVPVQHGNATDCRGYRIGDVAYLPDVKSIPPESLDLLQGLDLLILNCLRPRPHNSHLSIDESLAYAEALRPRRCLFTHMTHDIDYVQHDAMLPDWARFAYDGQVVEV